MYRSILRNLEQCIYLVVGNLLYSIDRIQCMFTYTMHEVYNNIVNTQVIYIKLEFVDIKMFCNFN